VEPKVSFSVLNTICRHHWYLTGQMVTLALADERMEVPEKEEMAMTLHNTPRIKIETGKPEFPVLDWRGKIDMARHRLSTLVTSNSWLIFNILKLEGKQVR
jgi:hypothetical protein